MNVIQNIYILISHGIKTFIDNFIPSYFEQQLDLYRILTNMNESQQ